MTTIRIVELVLLTAIGGFMLWLAYVDPADRKPLGYIALVLWLPTFLFVLW